MYIETPRMIIRNFTQEDATDLHDIFGDDEAIDDVKSVGLMQKLGMQLEGIQRSQTKNNHGNRADLYFYGLLEDAWRKQ